MVDKYLQVVSDFKTQSVVRECFSQIYLTADV